VKETLNSIDLLFSPDVYEAGEELLLSEIETNVFVLSNHHYRVNVGEETYEIFNPDADNPLWYSVDNPSDQNCDRPEAVVAFFKLKNHLSEQPKLKQQKLSLANILESVPNNELVNFIKNYAAKDRKLNVALKAHFSKYISVEDNIEKYRIILDSIIRPVQTKDQKLPYSDWTAFRAISRDMLDQAKDLVAIGEYENAFYILSSLITKISYLHHSYQKQGLEVTELSTDFHREMHNLLSEPIAPLLKDKIISYLNKLLTTSYYQIVIDLYNAPELMIKFAQKDKNNVLDLLKDKVKSSVVDNELIICYSIIIRMTKDFRIIEGIHITLVDRVVNSILLNHEQNIALEMLYYFAAKSHRSPHNVKIVKLLMEDNGLGKVEEVAELFINSKDLKVVDYLVTHHKDLIDSFVKYIGAHNKLSEIKQSLVYPYYLQKVSAFDELLSFLTVKTDLALIKNFDKDLQKYRPIPLALLYTSLVDDYLKMHLGEVSNDFIKSVFEHLYSVKAKESIQHLQKLIKNEYGHRQGLLVPEY
jgi:hypothetical protein